MVTLVIEHTVASGGRWAGAIHLSYLQDSLSRTRPDSFSLSRIIPILVQNGIF